MTTPDISELDLIHYALGDCASADEARVRQHLEANPDARRLVERVESVVQTLREDASVEPTPRAVHRAVRAFTDRAAPAAPAWLERLKRYVGTLVFDSLATPALAGFRGGTSRRLLGFENELGRLDVQILPPSDDDGDASWRIRAQFAGAADNACGAVLLVESDSGCAAWQTCADEQGQFELESSPGSFDLIVESDEGAFIAEGIRIDTD